MGMNVKTDGTPDLGQPIENIERDKYLIAHPSDIDDDFAGQFVRQGSANLCNHNGFWICFRMGLPADRLNRSGQPASAHPGSPLHRRFQEASVKCLPVNVTNRRCQSVSGIGRHLLRNVEKRGHHFLYLLLGGVAIPDHSRLDLIGAVLVDIELIFCSRQQGHTAGLSKFEGTLRIARKKNLLETDSVRMITPYDLLNAFVDAAQSRPLRLGTYRDDGAAGYVT